MGLGLLLALLTIILFGSWTVPTKTLPVSPIVQALWLTIGHLGLALVVFGLTESSLPLSATLLPLGAGFVWGVGIIGGFVGIRNLGITRAMGLWVPTVIIVSALWGLLYFGELWTLAASSLALAGVSIILVTVAATLVILSRDETTPVRHLKTGTLTCLALGIFHGSYFVPLHASDYSIFATFVPLSLGMVVATFLAVLIARQRFFYGRAAMLRMLGAGLIQGGGNYTTLLTLNYLGVTLGYPLTQLAIVVNALWGTLLFNEVTTRRGKFLVASSILIVLFGAGLLSLARSGDLGVFGNLAFR